jgi:hypothetical protein
MLGNFITSAFDWARQVQITPLRIEYVKRKESELYNKLLVCANKKQEEIRILISQTMIAMREELVNAAVDFDFSRNNKAPLFTCYLYHTVNFIPLHVNM